MEKRKFTRVPYKAQVVLHLADMDFHGETENISIHGMFLQGFQDVPLNQEVIVEISFEQPGDTPWLKTKAIPVRYAQGGTGFQFGAMDFSAFFALQEIVTRVSGTPGQVMTEIMSFINGG
jgi:hypothetical protein